MSLDLHIHSHYSDGTCSPQELVVMARKKGLRAVSITDHDTVAATAEAQAAGAEESVEIVPGIEMSTRHPVYSLHILGYFIDVNDAGLCKALEMVQEGRKERNKRIVDKLNQQGIRIDYRDVLNESGVGQMGRPHFAQVLLKKGVVKDAGEAFKKYLARGACAYVSRFLFETKDAIELIRSSGGLAVLAHPCQIPVDDQGLKALVQELSTAGLQGIETYYPTHSKAFRKKVKKLGEQYGLVLTGGSDYHGTIRPGTDLAGGVGMQVPGELLDKMKDKLLK